MQEFAARRYGLITIWKRRSLLRARPGRNWIGFVLGSEVRALVPPPGPHLRPGPAGIHGRPPPRPERDVRDASVSEPKVRRDLGHPLERDDPGNAQHAGRAAG